MVPGNENSRLLKLPPELRNQIYEHVVYSDHKVVIRDRRVVEPERALTAVCRQTRAEYRPIIINYVDDFVPKRARHFEMHIDDFLSHHALITTLDAEVKGRHFNIVVRLTGAHALDHLGLVQQIILYCDHVTWAPGLRDATRAYSAVVDWENWTTLNLCNVATSVDVQSMLYGSRSDEESIRSALDAAVEAHRAADVKVLDSTVDFRKNRLGG